ncbi:MULTISPECIES: glutamate synthase large subunit [unclassified Fusibacter]|uniref:glutamate synthase large subunit n=1 Tax=unclassified Fusibacter TaxID=2624464 RepID=UPI001011EACE|nr:MULTISPECIES: glutamate synthase large subunit [unclassified Fusibacter]MCK8059112.1 glutamate synthase large subunit [Fusibacter sp. A2]NPE22521.1 glutamate synthase large subunit [Fusibacter sp. A1]RXV60624.1 glutamate synthase large subunit [Fusibacter sp. A1]
MNGSEMPKRQGLYDPWYEKDNCGVGFVANIDGTKNHDVVKKAIEVLVNLTHRGASGSDANTGDGAGIMIQIPHSYLVRKCYDLGIDLPDENEYAVGMFFLPKEPALRYQCEGIVERMVEEEGHSVLGWRDVPTDNRVIGEIARGTEPTIRQVFISKSNHCDKKTFESDLYMILKRSENTVKTSLDRGWDSFYICSLSSRTVVYKGLLLPEQMNGYFIDLNDIELKSAMALVHSRFSTNTFPTWDLAHPYRYLAHNGEINTIRGNRNWMNAREGVLKSRVYKNRMAELYPIIKPGGSDSASLDQVFQLLKAHDYSNTKALMTLIPEAWENDETMHRDKRAFYEYNASMIEPWDGPAAVFFCDGVQIGATLDRNGLRPAKYVITAQGLIVLASELGVLEFEPSDVIKKGRLEPGKMLVVDSELGEVLIDDAVKRKVYEEHAYSEMTSKYVLRLSDLPAITENYKIRPEALKEKQMSFGFTMEDVQSIIKVMVETGKEPMGAMGNDTPLAVLSHHNQSLFNYFRQLFAQVTNPPIDPIREKVVMSLGNFLGSQSSILREEQVNKYIKIESPILSNEQMGQIRALKDEEFKSTKIPITFKADSGVEGFKHSLKLICERASRRVQEGYNILILSDKKVDGYEAAIPSLLAVSAIHHHLIEEKTRTKVSIVVEAGDARETTHMALLIGFGASAVNPYMAIESAYRLIDKGLVRNMNRAQALENYKKALENGLLKILSKMGICTIQSYHGAQIFEALGLGETFVDRYFPGTPSRIGGIGLDEIAAETLERHYKAFNRLRKPFSQLDIGGVHAYKRGGEFHLFNPETIHLLQQATRTGSYEVYKNYASMINDQSENPCTIRSLFNFKSASNQGVELEEVEPISEIVKRFVTGAMSFGSLSKEAHETIAIAMNRIGGKSNSGEGGEDSSRYLPDSSGDLRRSAIKQVASARFGVTTNYMVNADELQIKVAQGAKPGEGGHLPGKKVNEEIAKVRNATPGIDLISPPPHHDIYSIEDLAQLIYDCKMTNPDARVSVKLVSEVGIGTIAAGVAKAHADMILISGHDGGTGASPLSSIKSAGIPWEIGLSEVHQVLLLNDLRSRVRLQTDGQLKTGRDVVIATLLGAEEFGFATTALVIMGCTMLRHCNKNNCDLGVATQDPELRKHFSGKPEYLINFMTFIATEVREIMSSLGFKTMDEMVGRVDLLERNKNVNQSKVRHLDLSGVLHRPDMPKRIIPYCAKEQEHGLESCFDHLLIKSASQTFEHAIKTSAQFELKNTHRSVGAMLSGKIVKCFGEGGLNDDTITFRFKGSAGQSFGAFGANGLTMLLEGEANDYVGKGLSGATLAIKTPSDAGFAAHENDIAGNTILYGATSGKLFVNGKVGERFAVRNSGAVAVVEGTGNHCCEYMTGGTVVVLGETGKNFAAGMSGGQAFVYDPEDSLSAHLVKESVEAYDLDTEGEALVKELIAEHVLLTGSQLGSELLMDWTKAVKRFRWVLSPIYKGILEKNKHHSDNDELVS